MWVSNRLFLLFMQFIVLLCRSFSSLFKFYKHWSIRTSTGKILASLKWLIRRSSHQIQPFQRKFQRSDRNVEQWKHCLGEERTQSAYFFFRRGFARKRRRPREMSSFEKSIWNSLTTPEQEQEVCRVCVPMLGQPTAWTALLLDLKEHVKDKCCLDALPEWSRRGLLPAPRTKWSGLTAMSLASRSPSKENGHHVTVVLLRSFLLLPSCTSQPESPVSSCTACGGVVQARKKKSVGSWFVAESAPLVGELSWRLTYLSNTLRKLRGYIYGFFLLLPKGGSPWPYNRMEGKEVGQLDKVANRASIQVDIFLPSSEYEPLPISRTEISRSFFRCSNGFS